MNLYRGDGTIKTHYEYDSWGKVLSVTDGNGNPITAKDNIGHVNPIRYRGYYYDTDTGLYYLKSRYYDPEIGRFINADDTEVLDVDAESLLHYNLFAYCWNNPMNMSDDEGYLPWFVASALCGALFDTAAYLIGSAISGQKITWAGLGKAALIGAISGVAFGAVGKGVKALTTAAKATKAGAKVFNLGSKAISKAVSSTSRLQHAFKHAKSFGFGSWNKTVAKQWECFIRGNLSNYTKKFSAKLGKDSVIGYYRYFNGKHIATYVYKSGKNKGLVATVVELSSNQMTKYKLW
ncbi:MAG: RHS repeat-associated core domain-containing protein [Acutalibacteraceae bacterium]